MWNFNYKKNAIIDAAGTTLTYAELEAEGKKLADAVGERCLVFSLCTNTAASVMGYSAFINHSIVPVLLNANIDEQLLGSLLETYKPSFVWAPVERLIGGSAIYEAFGYQLIRTEYGLKHELHPELALLLTTSGSTGSPKLVRQTYQNIRANAESIVSYLELTEDERPVSTLPMNYTYGLSIINSHLLVGATLLMTDFTIMQKEFWAFFKEQEATSFGGVPYTYEMLDRLRLQRMKLPSLRYMTQAGGKLSPALHLKMAEFARDTGRKFIVMYGQCEATARMGYLPSEYAVEKAGSMGIAIPNGKLLLIDAAGNEIAESEVVGELVYEGPNVTFGYAENAEDLKKGDERFGRLETGDMAKRDADGFFYIVGRKKRFLKVYGNRVNLDEVDRLIKENFEFIDCASGGIDDHLYIFLCDESKAAAVREFVTEKTHLNPVAIKAVVIPEIPKNDSGKVRYKELEAYYS